MLKYKCEHCKRTLLAKDFYPVAIKYGYMSCRVCTDEKRKAHKEGLSPNYKVYTEQPNIITPKYTEQPNIIIPKYGHMPKDLASDGEMGQVYIIGVTTNDKEDCFDEPVKIGYTVSSVKNRLSQLNSSHWKNLEIIYESDWIYYPKMLEKYLHTKYKKQRIGKEWFKLEWNDLDEIQDDCETLTSLKYDIAKEFLFLKEDGSNLDRINLLSRLYPNILDANWYNSDNYDAHNDDWKKYWNEDDMRYYYENCYLPYQL
jgi:hypothetical protein